MVQLLRCRDRWWVGSKMNAPRTWQEEQSQKLRRIWVEKPCLETFFLSKVFLWADKSLYKYLFKSGVIGVYCVWIKQPCSPSYYNHRIRKEDTIKFWDRLVSWVSLSCHRLEVFTRSTKLPDRHDPPLLPILKTPQQPLSSSPSTILSFKTIS